MAISLKELQDIIQKQILRSSKGTIAKKSDIAELIELTSLSLANNGVLITNLGKSIRQEWAKLVVVGDGEYARVYAKLIKGLNNNAAAIEKAEPMTIVTTTCKSLKMMLDDLQSKVDKEFPDQLNIFTAKYSHLALLGAIQVCAIYSNFATYLISGLINETTDTDISIPEYRLRYVQDQFVFAEKLINDVAINTGPLAVNYVLKELRVANNDLPVVDQNDKPNTGFFNITKSSSVTVNMIERGLSNPFFTIGRLYIQWKDAKIRRLQQEKEWMEANIALLKLRLDKYDRDDPQYQRLLKIVQSYSDQIAKIDRALEKYYSSSNE